jgi:hypothetical protein
MGQMAGKCGLHGRFSPVFEIELKTGDLPSLKMRKSSSRLSGSAFYWLCGRKWGEVGLRMADYGEHFTNEWVFSYAGDVADEDLLPVWKLAASSCDLM